MPLYEFDCAKCRHGFEALVRRDETPACPQCSSHEVAKRLSVPARPAGAAAPLPVGGGCGSGPPCGAPWCGRKG
jgi:putative FmdB family regulatory protein